MWTRDTNCFFGGACGGGTGAGTAWVGDAVGCGRSWGFLGGLGRWGKREGGRIGNFIVSVHTTLFLGWQLCAMPRLFASSSLSTRASSHATTSGTCLVQNHHHPALEHQTTSTAPPAHAFAVLRQPGRDMRRAASRCRHHRRAEKACAARPCEPAARERRWTASVLPGMPRTISGLFTRALRREAAVVGSVASWWNAVEVLGEIPWWTGRRTRRIRRPQGASSPPSRHEWLLQASPQPGRLPRPEVGRVVGHL